MSTDPEAGPQPHPDVSQEIQEGRSDPGEVGPRPGQKGRRVVIGRPVVRRRRCCSVPALCPHLLFVLILGGLYARYILATVERQNLLETQQLQISLIAELQKMRNPEELCPEGWRRYRCSCYNLSTETKTWNASRADCRSRGAQLVTIENAAEQKFVKMLSAHADFWIGLESVMSWDVKWLWVDGKVLTYSDFPKDMSISAGIKYYVYINKKTGRWSSVKDGTKRWVCEKLVADDEDDV